LNPQLRLCSIHRVAESISGVGPIEKAVVPLTPDLVPDVVESVEVAIDNSHGPGIDAQDLGLRIENVLERDADSQIRECRSTKITCRQGIPEPIAGRSVIDDSKGVYEAKVGLVHKRRCGNRAAWRFFAELTMCEPAQPW
jgi:hypothetical protein